MKRLIIPALLLLLITVFLISGDLNAQGGRKNGCGKGKCSNGCFVDANNDGICDNFVDANGDGKCDSCTRNGSCNGTGKGCKGGKCGNFVDANNDGICDNFVDANGDGKCDSCIGNGACNGAGKGCKGGKCGNFVDANNDGICDNFVDANGDGKCDSGNNKGCGKGKRNGGGCKMGNTANSDFSLGQNVPNPFSATTTISYELKADGDVVISLYNKSGDKVRDIFSGTQTAGTYTVELNSENLDPGIYFYRMTFNGKSQTRKLIVE